MFTEPRIVYKLDYFGNLYKASVMTDPKRDYSKAWETVRQGLNKGFGGFGKADLAGHNERILKEKEDSV